MADLLETPSRLLKRVQQYEDIDLPSLPSISHDVDGDQTTDYPDPDDSVTSGNEEWSTPQVGRPFPTPPLSRATTVRERSSLTYTQSPLASNDSFSDFHSSPHKQLSVQEPSFLADLSQSRNVANKAVAAHTNESDFWEDSLASHRLPAAKAETEDGSDAEELSFQEMTNDTSATSLMDTPLPRHYQRKVPNHTESTATKAGAENRIPSLTRSEVSGTDQEATTPESHERIVNMTTSQRHDVTDVTSRSMDETHDTNHIEHTRHAEGHAKPPSTSSQTVTPAVMRYMDTPDTAVRAAATPFGVGAALRDVTRRHANYTAVPRTPFTPSVDYHKTPRAALDDAERRKNHVLSVLATSTLPSRTKRFTPHPRRHVSVGPAAESISEESLLGIKADDESRSINESFISIASSQDLTPDRRGSRAFGQRANTSVPNILYSGAVTTSPGVSHLDSRPDTVKIQKHLNMMNQQLLDNNADLAREAEEWRSECTRLIGIMREAGIQIDDDGNVVGELPKLHDDDGSHRRLSDADTSSAGAPNQEIDELKAQLRERDDEIATLRDRMSSLPDTLALTDELEKSRKAHDALKEEFAQKTKDHTSQFRDICSEFEEQVQQLEAQIRHLQKELETAKAANGPADHEECRVEIASLRDQIQRLEADLGTSKGEIAALRTEAETRASELKDRKDRVKAVEAQLSDLDQAKQAAVDALDAAEAARVSAETAKDSAIAEVAELRRQLTDMEHVLATNQAVLGEQRESLSNLETLADQEHQDLEETQRLLREARKELSDMHSKLSDKDQEIEMLRGQAELASLDRSALIEDTNSVDDGVSIVKALGERLEAAHKEIGRLKHEAHTAPIHQSTLEARDARISALETEKLALVERLKALEVSSPARWSNSMMTSTPLHKTVTSLRYPSTPGPLQDISWLQSTIGDSNESILRAQLEHLQRELDIANSQLDRNFGRLEEAGLSAVELAERLAAAHDRIAALEEELALLARESRDVVAEANAGHSRNERLESALEKVHEQMASLKDDMSREKERLQDDNRRLRVMLADVQSRADEEIEALGVEIANAQREFEDQCDDYQERLQAMRDEKDGVDAKLRSARETVETLQSELEKARGTADKAEQQQTMLREENVLLVKQQSTLLTVQESLKEARRATEELRAELDARTQELVATQRHVQTFERERSQIARELVDFAKDLDVQQRECANFGNELAALRIAQAAKETDYAQKAASLEAKLALAHEQQVAAEEKTRATIDRHAELARQLAALESQSRDAAMEQRQKYKVQTRRLSAQIEYLKAKYTRENTFRNALALQKKFFILLVGGMSLTEQATLKIIASMGYERPLPSRPKRRLKAVAIAVLSVIRAGRIAKEWRTTREIRAVGTARG